jgi:hypothetical protein
MFFLQRSSSLDKKFFIEKLRERGREREREKVDRKRRERGIKKSTKRKAENRKNGVKI